MKKPFLSKEGETAFGVGSFVGEDCLEAKSAAHWAKKRAAGGRASLERSMRRAASERAGFMFYGRHNVDMRAEI